MHFAPTALNDVIEIRPARLGDSRGYFAEIYNAKTLAALGLQQTFVQDNHSVSVHANTLRGLHFQASPHAQGKLVRCGRGAIFDVAVDIRPHSAQFGKWVGRELSAENGLQLYIPPGFAHGFVTLDPMSEIIYKCTQYYQADADRTLRWDDPELGIDWPLSAPPILSEKDQNAPGLHEVFPELQSAQAQPKGAA